MKEQWSSACLGATNSVYHGAPKSIEGSARYMFKFLNDFRDGNLFVRLFAPRTLHITWGSRGFLRRGKDIIWKELLRDWKGDDFVDWQTLKQEMKRELEQKMKEKLRRKLKQKPKLTTCSRRPAEKLTFWVPQRTVVAAKSSQQGASMTTRCRPVLPIAQVVPSGFIELGITITKPRGPPRHF